jgi:hypothetical protein
MKTREQQTTLAVCIAIHTLLLGWLFANMTGIGAGGSSQPPGELMYISALPSRQTAQPQETVKTTLPPQLPLITDTSLPPVPMEALQEFVQSPTLDSDTMNSTPSAPVGGGYDDPYAGAAINDFQGSRSASPLLPSTPPLPPPQLDIKRWQKVVNTLKDRAGAARSLALLVQIDTQGRVIDCQIIGGDAPIDLQQRSCALLKGQPLFSFETPPSETQWRSLPEIVF